MWLVWKWVGLGLMVITYSLLFHWQKKRRLSPCTGVSVVTTTMMFFDWLATWFGQRSLYWQGIVWTTAKMNMGLTSIPYFPICTVNEINPLGWFLLTNHPMAFALGFILYMVGFVILIRLIHRWSRFLVIAIGSTLTATHGYFAFEWVSNQYLIAIIMKWFTEKLKIDSLPFFVEYLPFIIIGLLIALLFEGIKKRNRH